MTKRTKKYEDMNNEEKAQVIYDTLLQDQPATLKKLLVELSPEYSDEEILTVEDWLDYFKGKYANNILLVEISQRSSNLDINDKYIREGIDYDKFKTSDDILELVDGYEAISWITMAIYDDSPYIEDFNPADGKDTKGGTTNER